MAPESHLDCPASIDTKALQMRSVVRPVYLSLLCCLAPMAAQAMELAKYPQVLTGPQGIEVVLAPSTDGTQALVRVSGVNHPIDQVVFLSTMERRGSAREVYPARIDGRDHGLLHKQASRYGGSDEYVLYLPGKRDGVQVGFSEKSSKNFKLADLQASYAQQQKQGVQEKLARFDRSKRQAGQQADLTKTDQDATAACGAPIQTTVDWASIDDEKLQALSIASFCGVVAAEMESLCSADPKFKSVAATLGKVSCQFASRMNIRVANSQVQFSTEKDAPNQGEFVRQFLRNQ